MARAKGFVNNVPYVPSVSSAGSVLLSYVGEVCEANRELVKGQEQLPPSLLVLTEVYSAVNRAFKPTAKRIEPPYCNVPWRVLRGLEAAINQECAKLLVNP